ncbi:polysaccharide biosynthesis C-terminal domain-containing protein [Streptomyces sp. ISL-96]|uniref:MATE family efflux transporter n=1 Tax=Streptomyces sp. ISL-96 TaxID=2819191 RepID=UPI001BE9A87D|nr:MATE family efflux transporter [Streptomyces sp. ISL-96]MBT2488594.1 polysaccharide biosynthesis C-terminal domain-containing protein [Streptomyces sp. ISL-96]
MKSLRTWVDPSIAREVVQVSLPLMFGMAGNLVMMLVDRIALARYSEATLIASGPAVFTGMTIIMFVTGIAGITRSYVAQAHGRGDSDAAADEGAAGVLLAVGLAVLLLLATPLITRIPELSSRPADSVALESVFLEWSARFGAVMTINMALASYFNGTRKTRVPMVVGVVGQVVGVVMCVGLIFGRFGLPELGMRGSGIATFIAVSVMFAGYVVCLPRTFYSGFTRLLGNGARRIPALIGARLGKGAPSGGSSGLEEMGHTSFVWIAGLLGPVALAANNVALSLNYVAIIPLIGLGIGCSILSGNSVGENKHERVPLILRATLAVASVYVLTVAFFQIFLPTLLLSPFGLDGADPATMSTAVDTSRVLWMYSVAFMFSMFGGAVLESFGLTRFVFLTRIAVVWVLSVPTILIIALANRDSSGVLVLIWVVYSLFEGVMGALYFWRIRRAAASGENQLVKPAREPERSAEGDVQPV